MVCRIVRQNGVHERESGGDCAGKVGKGQILWTL